MKTQKRTRRMWTLPAALGLALLTSGCIIHTHDTRDDWYETQSRTVTTNYSYGYVGGHVIPDSAGGGWCFVTSQHHHSYAPDYPSYYGDSGGYYSYRGPVSFYYYGYHPIPTGHGNGYCNLHGRHVHRYAPGRRGGWQYHSGRRYYWYDDRNPRRDPHPAEPAWADRNPRGEPARGTAYGPGRPAPARAASSASRGSPAPARPATSSPAAAVPARRPDAVRAEPVAPVRRYGGWEPTTGSVDLGEAESERGGTVVTPPPARPGYQAAPAVPTGTVTSPRPTYGATPATTTGTVTSPRPTYGANPATPTGTVTSPRPTYGANPTTPTGTVTSPRPTYGATPTTPSGTVTSPRTVDPRWRATPRDPTGGTVNTAPARSGGAVRVSGPAKAERAKRGDKEDLEAKGVKKKKTKKASPASGTPIRLSPATPAKRVR